MLNYTGGTKMVDFGTMLKELRRRTGITQKELADKLGLSKAAVSYYEQSLRSPSPEILIKIAEVFHVTTDHLLGLENKRQTLDVTGLSCEDIEFLQNAAEFLRRKNNEREMSHRKKSDRGR